MKLYFCFIVKELSKEPNLGFLTVKVAYNKNKRRLE